MTAKIRKCRRGHIIAENNESYGTRPDTGEYWPRCRACVNTYQVSKGQNLSRKQLKEIADWKYKTYTTGDLNG